MSVGPHVACSRGHSRRRGHEPRLAQSGRLAQRGVPGHGPDLFALAVPEWGYMRCRRIRLVYSQIASNKRRSVIFIVLFFVIWLAIGAACGLHLQGSSTGPRPTPASRAAQPTHYGWTPVIIGMVICGVLAVGGIIYSLSAGAGLVLRVSGAVPADPGPVPAAAQPGGGAGHRGRDPQARRLRDQ